MVSDAANNYDNAAGGPCPVVEGSVTLKKVLSLRAADSEGLSARTRNIEVISVGFLADTFSR